MKSLLMMAALVGCTLAEGPSLSVYKRLNQEDLVAGKDATVTVTIFNKGSASAFDVSMDDTHWGGGNQGLKKTWTSIAADEAVSAEYVVSPGEAGSVLSVEPAKVTFSAEAGAEAVKVAFSNNLYDTARGPDGITILSQAEFDKKASFRVKEWFTFLLLLVIPLGMPFFFYQQSNNTLTERKAAEGKTEVQATKPKKSSPGKKSSPRRN